VITVGSFNYPEDGEIWRKLGERWQKDGRKSCWLTKKIVKINSRNWSRICRHADSLSSSTRKALVNVAYNGL